MKPVIDLVGKRFGRLTVLARASGHVPGKHICWVCRCDCGEYTKQTGYDLRGNRVKSCGCLRKDNARQMGRRDRGVRPADRKAHLAKHPL